MKHYRPADAAAATPEHLAAYVDGQLDPALRKEVETWLRDHPEVAAEIEEHRQLARLWQATTPVEPEGANWATVLARLDSAFFRYRLARVRRRRLLRRGAAAGLAAALLLLLWWPPAAVEPAVEPLAVVSPDDVDIVSLRAADRVTLVVGVPPVTGPLVLASPGDIQLEGVEPYADGMVPDIHMDDGAVTPMIVAPLDVVPARAPGNLRE